jgi:hypothetical protein
MSKQTKTTLAALLATSVAAFAGTTTKNTKPIEKETGPVITGAVGFDVASGYINRGRVFDTSSVFQPFAAVILPTKLELGGVKVAVVASTKQNFHSDHTSRTWSRSEVNAGLSFNKDRFTLTSTFEYVDSHNDWFKETQGVNLTLSFDDVGLGPIPLKPYARTYLGTKRVDQPTANYYEVGIAPTFSVYNTSVAIPVTAGFGDRNFYRGGENYGYTSVGISTATPLTNTVSLITSATYFSTNNNINTKNDNLWLTSAGIVVKF